MEIPYTVDTRILSQYPDTSYHDLPLQSSQDDMEWNAYSATRYTKVNLITNPDSIGIQGYNTNTNVPVYTSNSYAQFPVIPMPSSSYADLAYIITGNMGIVIRGEHNRLMDQYCEIEFYIRSGDNTPDSGSIYIFYPQIYLEPSKIVSYGLNLTENDMLVSISTIYDNRCTTIFTVDYNDYKLKRAMTVA